MSIRSTLSLERAAARELAVCAWFNRGCRYSPLRNAFSLISWLGDGKFWYALMAALPLLYGRAGLDAALRMAAAGLAGVALYKLIKSGTHRSRPYVVNRTINLGATPLDRYSFPSGHTLHAVAFTTVAVSCFPPLAWLLVPFALLVALSRVILGLHYPTDVGVGALIGLLLAGASLQF